MLAIITSIVFICAFGAVWMVVTGTLVPALPRLIMLLDGVDVMMPQRLLLTTERRIRQRGRTAVPTSGQGLREAA